MYNAARQLLNLRSQENKAVHTFAYGDKEANSSFLSHFPFYIILLEGGKKRLKTIILGKWIKKNRGEKAKK